MRRQGWMNTHWQGSGGGTGGPSGINGYFPVSVGFILPSDISVPFYGEKKSVVIPDRMYTFDFSSTWKERQPGYMWMKYVQATDTLYVVIPDIIFATLGTVKLSSMSSLVPSNTISFRIQVYYPNPEFYSWNITADTKVMIADRLGDSFQFTTGRCQMAPAVWLAGNEYPDEASSVPHKYVAGAGIYRAIYDPSKVVISSSMSAKFNQSDYTFLLQVTTNDPTIWTWNQDPNNFKTRFPGDVHVAFILATSIDYMDVPGRGILT